MLSMSASQSVSQSFYHTIMGLEYGDLPMIENGIYSYAVIMCAIFFAAFCSFALYYSLSCLLEFWSYLLKLLVRWVYLAHLASLRRQCWRLSFHCTSYISTCMIYISTCTSYILTCVSYIMASYMFLINAHHLCLLVRFIRITYNYLLYLCYVYWHANIIYSEHYLLWTFGFKCVCLPLLI